MELKDLRTFRAVAELGSLSKAAIELHIAQPSLSRQIKTLEAETRQELFTRDGRGMRLTMAGEYLLKRTENLVQVIDHLRDDMRSFEQAVTGEVHMGMIPTFSNHIAADVACRVLDDLPQVSLRLAEGYAGVLQDWLTRGVLDVAVMYDAVGSEFLHHEELLTEELVVVSAADRPLETAIDGSGVETVPKSWLFAQPFALPSPGHGLRRIIVGAADRLDAIPNVVVEADSFRILIDIVSRGRAVTVLPASAVRSYTESGDLLVAPVEQPGLSRKLSVVYAREPNQPVRAVVGLLRDELERSGVSVDNRDSGPA